MKDYYYILGVTRTASIEDIKQAYRKLSVKFHPDKNDGDKFFEDRFKEINEAYEILNNTDRRQKYDAKVLATKKYAKYTQQDSASQAHDNNTNKSASPSIIFFKADKNLISIGETIIFTWEVQNASTIILKPFGQVPSVGQKAIKPLGFNEAEGLIVELRAINESTGEIAEQKIFITNREREKNKSGKVKNTPPKSTVIINSGRKRVIIFYVILISVSFLFILDDLSQSKSPSFNKKAKSASQIIPKDTSVRQESRWRGNQLEDGSSPFNSCFGKGNRSGRSWISFKNKNEVDAVVCLINMLSNKTIRNEYIRAGSEFKMSNVPSGRYTLKVLFGNDWNPELASSCGSIGFFESNVSFSVSDGYNDTINVETVNDGYSITYSTHTITLYPVANGNMSQHSIDANQFFSR